MLIDPVQLPRLAVAFMNVDHAEEARLLNAAGEKLDEYRSGTAGRADVTAALDALYLHTRAHFSREEAAMMDASFPAYTFHRAEHVRTLGELGEAQRRFHESGDADALAAYLATVPVWLAQHVETMDAATARYVAEWGG